MVNIHQIQPNNKPIQETNIVSFVIHCGVKLKKQVNKFDLFFLFWGGNDSQRSWLAFVSVCWSDDRGVCL